MLTPMHLSILARGFCGLLLCAALLTAPVIAAAAEPGTTSSRAINTVCPVTGKPVDAQLAPVMVVIGRGEKAKRFAIGIAVASAADVIKNDPQKYADAAKANKKAE